MVQSLQPCDRVPSTKTLALFLLFFFLLDLADTGIALQVTPQRVGQGSEGRPLSSTLARKMSETKLMGQRFQVDECIRRFFTHVNANSLLQDPEGILDSYIHMETGDTFGSNLPRLASLVTVISSPTIPVLCVSSNFVHCHQCFF